MTDRKRHHTLLVLSSFRPPAVCINCQLQARRAYCNYFGGGLLEGSSVITPPNLNGSGRNSKISEGPRCALNEKNGGSRLPGVSPKDGKTRIRASTPLPLGRGFIPAYYNNLQSYRPADPVTFWSQSQRMSSACHVLQGRPESSPLYLVTDSDQYCVHYFRTTLYIGVAKLTPR